MPKGFKLHYKGIDYLGVDRITLANNIIKNQELKRGDLPQSEKENIKKLSLNNASDFNTGGHKEYKPQEPNKRKLSLNETINGAKAFIKVLVGQSVSQSEINRRVRACSAGNSGGACPKLSSVSNCKTCGGGGFSRTLVQWTSNLKQFFGGKKDFDIPNGLEGSYCDICGCSMALMLPSKIEAFDFEIENKKGKQIKRPEYCWLKQGGRNFKIKE